MIYPHHTYAPWEVSRWPNFARREFACRASGEYYHWPDFLDRLQAARSAIDRPFHIISGHRSYLHNYRVGGAPASEHLRLAVDISLAGHDRHTLRMALREAGFSGFGYYHSFIHIDLGRPRFWFGLGAKPSWQSAQFSA